MRLFLPFTVIFVWLVERGSTFKSQYHIQSDEGNINFFKYSTHGGQYRKEIRLDNGTVIGTFGWRDGTGTVRYYDYQADANGYRILNHRKMYEPYEPETTEPTNNDIVTNEIGDLSVLQVPRKTKVFKFRKPRKAILMRRKDFIRQGNRGRKIATERFVDLTNEQTALPSSTNENIVQIEEKENQDRVFSSRSLQVEHETTKEIEIDDDLQTTTQLPLRRARTKPYQRRNHVSAPYQARENLVASIGRQRPAPYQRRQQITVPYQEIENPLKVRANSAPYKVSLESATPHKVSLEPVAAPHKVSLEPVPYQTNNVETVPFQQHTQNNLQTFSRRNGLRLLTENGLVSLPEISQNQISEEISTESVQKSITPGGSAPDRLLLSKIRVLPSNSVESTQQSDPLNRNENNEETTRRVMRKRRKRVRRLKPTQ